MDINNQTTTPFLKLKGKYKEYYSIDKLSDDSLVISPLQPMIDIFETLTLCDINLNEICSINLSEIFIDALIEAIERNKVDGGKEPNMFDVMKGGRDAVNSFVNSKIVFRELVDCFPNIKISEYNDLFSKAYNSPNNEKVVDDRKTSRDIEDSLKEQIFAQKNTEPKKPFVRETPKVAVNDPCPCGSGLKYKKCCKDKESNNIE